jgi:hypothetical protein
MAVRGIRQTLPPSSVVGRVSGAGAGSSVTMRELAGQMRAQGLSGLTTVNINGGGVLASGPVTDGGTIEFTTQTVNALAGWFSNGTVVAANPVFLDPLLNINIGGTLGLETQTIAALVGWFNNGTSFVAGPILLPAGWSIDSTGSLST